MDCVTGIGIGGVNLGIWCADRVEFEPPDPGYESFVGHLADGPDTINVKITLEPGQYAHPFPV